MFGRNDVHRGANSIVVRRLNFESLEERVVMSATSLAPEAGVTAAAVVADPVPAAALNVIDWVHSLVYYQFSQLQPDEIQYLTTQQIASIPNAYYFGQLSSPTRAALSQAQVRALTVSNVHLDDLTAQQISWLTVAQIQSLTLQDFKFLSPSQIPELTPAQVATIPDPGPFAEWTPVARAALTQPQIQALRVATVWLDRLTPQQISWLTIPQIRSLRVADFKYLAPTQTPWLTTAQIASIPDPGPFAEWTPASRAALTATQIQALDVANVWLDRLTAQQVGWLTIVQIWSLRVADFKYLGPNQTPHLTTAQIAAIPDPGPFAEWTPAARAALTSNQIPALNVATVWIDRLSPQQVAWLTAAQIRSLRVADFQYLSAAQTPYLTPAQIAAIPDPGPFAEWTAEARAALTAPQIQALNVATVWIDRLTPQQVAWLTVAQIRSLRGADFKYLGPAQTPFLTTAQIASIPDPGPFSDWSAAARAALTAPQIQALDVAAVWIDRLTPQQVAWLTVGQIRSLRGADFQYLNAQQTPYLSLMQIASIPDPGPFAAWSDAARAALTAPQIQVLNTPVIGINLLTPQQIGWLTLSQIRVVNWTQFGYLSPNQIPLIAPEQFAKIPTAGLLRNLSDESEIRLTREQLMALSSEVFARYTVAIPPPYDTYVPAVDVPVDANGVATGHHALEEAQHVFDLVPLAAATHVAIASGNWSDPRIWQGGQMPTAGARVVIASNAVVRFDVQLSAQTAINTLRIDGTLSFAAERNTQLFVDTIVVYTTGKLHIGTAAAPIADNVTARIVITGGGPIDTSWDPYLFSRGLISRGEVRMYGKDVTPYQTLSVAPTRGTTQLLMTDIPVNWEVGDALVLMGVHPDVPENQSEDLVIRAINGNVVTVDPLRYDHVPPAGFGLSIYLANMSRNIEFRSAENAVPSQRPHMMFLHNPDVDIANISVVGFGRTDKTIPINDAVVVNGVLQPGTGTNVRARYAIHFHHTGVNPAYAPAVVRGSVVEDSAGWGYVNHSSNVTMQNNISYHVVGAGFVAEDGNEIGTMVGNLAMNSTGSGDQIESRSAIHDFGHGGHGFWLQSPGIAVINNIAFGHADAAFAYFTSSAKTLFDAVNLSDPALAGGRKAIPVGSAPLKAFIGNIAATSKSGLETWFHQTRANQGQTYIDNFTAWNLRFAGVFLFYTGRTTVRNSTLVGRMELFRGTGVDTIGPSSDISLINLRVEGWEKGIVTAGRRANLISGATINAFLGIYIKLANDSIRTLDIDGQIIFKTGTSAQLAGRVPYPIYATGKVDFEFQSLASVLSPDHIRFTRSKMTLATVYFPEQAGGYVPFPKDEFADSGVVPAEYLDLTNEQLRARFGVSLGGRLPPADAVSPNGYRARLDYTPGR
jgi:hypothetical protein